MRKFAFVLLLLAGVSYAHAETILLRTGARVIGTVLFQNEEVVVVRDAAGARFQYPRTDVEQILAEDVPEVVEEEATEPEPEQIKVDKKASILIELAGGAAMRSNEQAGGGFGADIVVGTHHIGDKHLFIGGGFGYHGLFIGGEKYNFLPVQVAFRMPLMEQKHAPVFGASLGYGIALSKNYTGGIYAGLDFGYRCQLNPRSAVGIVLFAQFHQAKVDVMQTVETDVFMNKTWRNLVTTGIKLAFYL